MRSIGVSYLLWCTSLLGLAGVHRFYNGKYVSGFFWLFTFGFFGVGQLIDLALIPGMVEDKNLKYKLLHSSPDSVSANPQVIVRIPEPMPPTIDTANAVAEQSDVHKILQLVKDSGGAVSMADCVLVTGKSIAEVKNTIEYLCSEDLLQIDNHPETGSIIYKLV
ncbi:NINE protein [Lyngbya aestuarii]|uniref:NINE protein n=1 Tax=Lyngbya aestuarii TaxID=118322 RepID=UPI00403DDBC2